LRPNGLEQNNKQYHFSHLAMISKKAMRSKEWTA
jgi:hypothetical protein